MPIKALPPRALVRQLLSYDADTGVFTWRPRPREMFTREGMWRWWNKQFAGKIAGCPVAAGYIRIGLLGVTYRAHRLAWLYVHGEPVPDVPDHIDTDRTNNRIDNLRAATDADNQANSRMQSNNQTGVKGVTRRKRGFEAHIMRHGKWHYIGCFPTLEAAATARREAAERLHGKFVRHA
jgi:HNH endonuclease